mgnify:CR=1 FL=1
MSTAASPITLLALCAACFFSGAAWKTQQHTKQAQAQQQASTLFLAKVFNWMALGLGITGIVAFVTANTSLAGVIIGSPLFFILMIQKERIDCQPTV